jgi:hydroxymethylglutaryl-CoA lyase
MPTYPQKVVIEEQGLRDGLQPQKYIIPTQKKLEMINAVADAGVKQIQVTSFVHPQRVPQMADAEEVCKHLDHSRDVVYSGLVLNEKGVARAADAGLRHITASMSASDTHSRKNANASLSEARQQFAHMVNLGKQKGLKIRGSLQCVFGCRFEGRVHQNTVLDMVKEQLDLGIHEMALADSTGMAHPNSIHDISCKVIDLAGDIPVYLHLHDTEGKGLANVLAAMNVGISHFEAAFGGMGGCPFIKGASGNIATEDIVFMLGQMGIHTGIDVRKLAVVSRDLEQIMGKKFAGKMHHVLEREDIEIVY